MKSNCFFFKLSIANNFDKYKDNEAKCQITPKIMEKQSF